ncbi:MAG: hypothetical protein AAF710_00125 [Planctomycetota bacterium]
MPRTIDLECPSCKDLLELDAGFAGGVCRCSSCGILMTVPKLSGGQSEQLVRPSAPGESPSSPTESSTRPERPGRPDAPPSRSSRPSRSRTDSSRGRASSSRSKSSKSKKPTSRSKTKKATPPPPDREEVYQTASGKKVRINAARVPTANLRKTVRITTAGIVILFLAAVVASVVVFGIYLFSTNEATPPDLDQEGVVAVQEEAFQYNSTVDPFTLDQPHAVGFPLRDHTAVVFDTSLDAEGKLPALHAMLTHGLANQSSPKTLTLIAATAAGPNTLLDGSVELADLDPQALDDFLAQHPAQGQRQLDNALKAAIAAEPDLILLVAFGNPRRHADAITSALFPTGITTDILLVGGDSVTLERFLQDREGQLVRLPTSRFLRWHEDQSSP